MLGTLANLKAPNPASGDIPTAANLSSILGSMLTSAQAALTEVHASSSALGNNLSTLKTLQDAHTADLSTYQSITDDAENADTTTAVASLQALETQLTASYEVTRTVGQLSLASFLN